MSSALKTRVKGTELKDIKVEDYKDAFDKMGWPHKSSPVSRIMFNYVPDRSKRRLAANMAWMKKFVSFITTNINTSSARIYRLQKWLIKIYPPELKDMIKKEMVLSTEEYTMKNKASLEAREEQSKNVFTITKEDLLKTVDTLKSENSIAADILLIQMATGRRKSGVLTLADIPEKKGKSIVFTKIAKNPNTGHFKVPLYHLTYKELILRWKNLRNLIKDKIKDKDNVEISKLYAQEINELMEKLNLGSHGTHIFRKLYVAWALQFKPKRWTPGVYIKKILALTGNSSPVSAEHYSNVLLGDSTDMLKAKTPRAPVQNTVRDDLKRTILRMMKDGDKITARAIKAHGFGSSTYTKYFKGIMDEIT